MSYSFKNTSRLPYQGYSVPICRGKTLGRDLWGAIFVQFPYVFFISIHPLFLFLRHLGIIWKKRDGISTWLL